MRSQIICPVSFCLHPDCKRSVRARWRVIYSLSGLEVLSLWIIQTVVNRWMNNSSWIESIVILLMICRISNGCRRKCCNWSHESDYIISLDTTHTCTHVCAVCAAALASKKPEGLSLAVHHNMLWGNTSLARLSSFTLGWDVSDSLNTYISLLSCFPGVSVYYTSVNDDHVLCPSPVVLSGCLRGGSFNMGIHMRYKCAVEWWIV